MRRILIGIVAGLVALVSTNLWAASGDQKINLNSANVGATVTVAVSGTATVSASQRGEWVVEIKGTPSIRYLNHTQDNVKIYGDQGVPFKQDSNGQILAVVSPEAGVNIRKVYTFSNIAAGSWAEIGSYTVTAGKTLKIFDAVATGRFSIDFRVSTGVTGQELYLATSPSFATAEINITRPIPVSAGTVVRLSIKPDEAINEGTFAIGGFEY